MSGNRAIAENTVHCIDALELLRALPDGSVDAVITDPPYGQHLAAWDKPVDCAAFLAEAYRVAAPDSFLAFFHQLPQAIEWLVSAPSAGWAFVEHVVWLKRSMGRYAAGLNRGHESLFIYRKGDAQFVEIRGEYNDVKMPGLLTGAISIEGIERRLTHMDAKVRTGKEQIAESGSRRKEHIGSYRKEMNGDRIPETVNFTNVWSFLPQNKRPTESVDHPSVKPIRLLDRAIRLLTHPDALVVDPFAGSGTTLLAARNLGRRYIGSDTSPEYCELTRQRLDEPFMLPMFIEPESAS